MHYISLIFFFLLLSSNLSAQVSMEVMIPVGISSYTSSSLDRFNEVIGPNDYNYKSGISTGLDVRLSRQYGKNFTFQLALRYKRMQQRLVESLSRESYSWTFRETRIRTAEHQMGVGMNFRYAIFHFPNSTLSAQVNAGILYPIAHEAWIKQERRSYYNNEAQHYTSYTSEREEYILIESRYLNAGMAVVYSLGNGPVSWIFEAGYNISYFHGENWERSDRTAFDWNNFYLGVGTKFNLYEIESPSDQ